MPTSLDEALARAGFTFSELQTAAGLARVDAAFGDYLCKTSQTLAEQLTQLRERRTGTAVETSSLLLALAPPLQRFIIDLFGISGAAESARAATRRHDAVMAFKQEFVVKRVKKLRHPVTEPFRSLNAWLDSRIAEAADREQAVAEYAMALLQDPAANADAIERLTHWCKLARTDPHARVAVADWASFTLPARLDHARLVPLQRADAHGAVRLQANPIRWRRRNGFELTDTRMGARGVQREIHYCVYCHDHDGDFCSKGFPEKKNHPEFEFKTDPLGVTLTGCPLEEKISEMNVLKRAGHTIAALAMAMVDNPMVPATGHRICNDCMKSCIYQKQDPVNVPQIETRVLTDVLDLPWGVEIYHLLTRWNPLRQEQYLQQPDNGRRVLVAGMGPAGFTMAHHLTLEGCAVVGIDGLKVEPLPREILETPVERWEDLKEPLDERIQLGFGGVAEYGITVRWDKNFLKLIYLSLARRANFRVYGGVRLGGTLTLADAWKLGFDHVCNATGTGLPRVIHMRNSLARGMRQASDFLMALQLTGAAKASSLANLQVRLPAVVIGGGLTGIDTATEVQAYYVKQVEKILGRYEQLVAELGEQSVTSGLNAEDQETLAEFLEHGKAVRTERRRAAAAAEPPDFSKLLRQWGGVTVAYRKGLNASPAYIRNHEEVLKATEEGLFYAEGLEPLHVELDRFEHVQNLVCRRMKREEGRWLATREEVILPARSIFVAAGTVPNTLYEREYPGTFTLEGNHFLPHVAHANGVQPVGSTSHCKSPEFGPFTSYEQHKRRVTFLGDTHPAFHGSVVKAIASAKRSYPQVIDTLRTQPQASEATTADFLARMDDLLVARVAEIRQLNPALVEIWVRAPMAARNFRPGQFFRLQTFESNSPLVAGTRLHVPLLTVSGTGVRDDMLRLIVLQWGVAARLVGRLQVDEPLILMGPTGAPTDIPRNKTVLVVAGRWGAAVMLDIGAALRAAGNRVLYVAAFGSATEVDHQDELEAGADQILWCTARAPKISARREQDSSVMATDMVDVVGRYGDGEIRPLCGPTIGLDTVDRIMIMGGTGLLAGFQDALKDKLKPHFPANVEAIGTVGSPMQCMLKGVCAQCLQWQIDPENGERTRPVFSCAGQDQPLSWIDLGNLSARQQQNRLSDRLAALWLDHVLRQAGS